MRIERKFNKRSAQLIDVQLPDVRHGKGDALGVYVVFHPTLDEHEDHMEIGNLRMHLTPAESITLGLRLITAGRDRLKELGKLA